MKKGDEVLWQIVVFAYMESIPDEAHMRTDKTQLVINFAEGISF